MSKCKKCNKQRKYLSRRGICGRCSDLIQKTLVMQLKSREGSYYDKWCEGMIRYSKEIYKKKKRTKQPHK